MEAELKALRDEVARLREEIADLRAERGGTHYHYYGPQPTLLPPIPHYSPSYTPKTAPYGPPDWYRTCEGGSDFSKSLGPIYRAMIDDALQNPEG